MRRKKSDPQITHKHFGVGYVMRRKITDYGDALLVQFADKTRIVLVAGNCWANPEDAEAAWENAPAEPKPKQTPKRAIRVRAADELETAEVGEEGVG